MNSYYYLVSSLPSLYCDAPMPFTYDKFLDMCKDSVDGNTFEILRNLDFNTDKGSFFRKWNAFYGKLKNRTDFLRNSKIGKQTDAEEDRDSFIDSVAEAAMNAENPLIAEQILLKAQFDFLDSLVAMHYFDSTVLYGYALKLKLLERQSLFEQTKGKKEFERLFTSIQKQIYEI